MFEGRHRRALKLALALYLDGELFKCEKALAAVISELTAATSAADRRTLGEAWECQARIELDHGNHERAMSAFSSAIDALERDGSNRELLGRVEYQLATEFQRPGYENQARRLFASAREHLANSTEYRMLVERIDLGFGSGFDYQLEPDWRKYRDRLVAALDDYYERWGALSRRRMRRGVAAEREQLAWSITRTMSTLGTTLMRFGDDDEFSDGLNLLLDRAESEIDEITDLEGWLATLLPLAAVLDRPGVQLPERVASIVEAADEVVRRRGELADRAAVDFLWGLFYFTRDDVARAKTHALRSFSAAMEVFARTRNATLRASQLLESLLQYQQLALRIATQLQDARLAAELIEASRPQVLPAQGGDPVEGDSPLGNSSHVTVDGISVVGEAARELGLTERPTVALEDAVNAVGGFHAWWWGAWLGMSELFWATRDPDGTWHCGHRVLAEDAKRAVLEIGAVYHREDEDVSVPAPEWTVAAESRNAAVLSAAFLPEPLKRALATVGDMPLSIVAAGSFTGQIPLPTLTIGAGTDVRLVERAVIRVQPPTALVQQTRSNSAGDPFGPWPLAVACLDPKGDLPWARHEDLLAPRVLVAPQFVGYDREVSGEPATVSALRSALREVGRSENATFFYSGHVSSGHLPGDLLTHLVLADGALTAAEFFGVLGDGQLTAPSRVVLSACSSGGTSGSGSGEWFGLAGALLVAGARQVVATAWPIPDSAFGAEFERALLTATISETDPARALRALQVDALQRWRQEDIVAMRPDRVATPATFASYQCIGVLG